MNPENIVNYKIFLCAVGYEPEIRRMTIDKSVSKNYFYLKQRLINIFPTLKDVQFTISWKDKEGDSIRICTDEELAIALSEMEGSDFKKVYVSTTPQQGTESPLHPDITCDGCDRPVRGFRYKCMVCADYDLCADCERSQNHPDHPMVRIPLPITQDMPFGRRFARDMHKIAKHFEHFVNGFGRRWERAEAKRGEHSGHRGGGCGYTYSTFFKPCDMNSHLFSFPVPPHHMPSTPPEPEKPQKQPSKPAESTETAPQGNGNTEQTGSNSSNIRGEDEQMKFVEILKKGLTVILDPLGEGNIQIQTVIEPGVNKSTNSTDTESTPAPSAPDSTCSDSPNKNKTATEKDSSPVLDGWTVIPDVGGGTGDAVTLSPKPDEKMEAEEEEVKPAEPLYPKLATETQSTVTGSVEETVSRLLNMGFNNDDGWLSHLVEAKGGNIHEVLKFLTPIPKPSKNNGNEKK